jgi:hypothetical protein
MAETLPDPGTLWADLVARLGDRAASPPDPAASWAALGGSLGDWTKIQSADPAEADLLVPGVLPEAAVPFLGRVVAFRADPDSSFYSWKSFRLAGAAGLSFAHVMGEPARWLTAKHASRPTVASRRAVGLDLRPVLERGAMHGSVTISPLAQRAVYMRLGTLGELLELRRAVEAGTAELAFCGQGEAAGLLANEAARLPPGAQK